MWQFVQAPNNYKSVSFHLVYEIETTLNITYFNEEVQKAIWEEGEDYVIA